MCVVSKSNRLQQANCILIKRFHLISPWTSADPSMTGTLVKAPSNVPLLMRLAILWTVTGSVPLAQLLKCTENNAIMLPFLREMEHIQTILTIGMASEKH